MRYILLLLTLVSLNAYSDSISFGVVTKHNDVMMCGIECNEDNQLIAYEHNNIVVATFINSYDYRTYLVAKNFQLNEYISVLAGISHGYDRDCLNPSKSSCDDDGSYDKEFAPFASILIQKNFGKFKVSWLEAGNYRTLLVGLDF